MGKTIPAKKKQKKNKVVEKPVKIFSAQINCTCNKNCSERIDVIKQKEIFDQYHGYSKWSEQTAFLRAITKRESVKENFNPQINLKDRNYFCTYFFSDESGENQRVCSSFVTKLLQINRVKLFRAVSSSKNNPFAVDGRGKKSKRKTATEDVAFAKQFIRSFPCYESKFEPNSFDTKYLNPNLTMEKVYRLYANTCEFKQKTKLSKTIFTGIFKSNFPNLHVFKLEKSKCSICEHVSTKKKIKVLSTNSMDDVQKTEDDHFAELREFKNEFINSVNDPEVGVEVFAFELQRPLQMPLLPTDESHDLRCLWFSNLCIFNEISKKVHMYVWDETIAKRGPEEIGSCLFKHIADIVPKTTKKIILYCDALDIYRNMQIIAMLAKIFDQQESELQLIELRFFFSGHSKNDCNRCFDTIENKIKAPQSLFTPDDWVQLISSAKEAKVNFNVDKLNTNDFFSVQILMKKLTVGEINWSDVKAVILCRSEPLNMRLKYFSQNTEEIVPMYNALHAHWLTYKYKEAIPITKVKHDDLMKTLKYIPSEKRAYYENIQHDDNLNEADFTLASYTL